MFLCALICEVGSAIFGFCIDLWSWRSDLGFLACRSDMSGCNSPSHGTMPDLAGGSGPDEMPQSRIQIDSGSESEPDLNSNVKVQNPRAASKRTPKKMHKPDLEINFAELDRETRRAVAEQMELLTGTEHSLLRRLVLQSARVHLAKQCHTCSMHSEPTVHNKEKKHKTVKITKPSTQQPQDDDTFRQVRLEWHRQELEKLEIEFAKLGI